MAPMIARSLAEDARCAPLLLPLLLGAFGLACSSGDASEVPSGEAAVQQPISGSNAIIDNVGTTSEGDWVRAVGQLQLANGKNCSGTLVAPHVVLTAGHCFNDVPETDPGKFVIPNAPPDAKYHPQGPDFTIASWTRMASGNSYSQLTKSWITDRSHDIACAFLETAVPPSVVNKYPKVYTGGFYDGWQNKTWLPAFIAGFGGKVATSDLTSSFADGNRRWGTADPHKKNIDACDDYWECGHCNDAYQWVQDRIANPQPEKGDSGGPLVMTTPDGAERLIAGVFSGYYDDDWPCDVPPRTVWSPTGNPGGEANGSWIVKYCLGGDADTDGIPDWVDNCPPSQCTDVLGVDASQCANPDQADTDHDGVGEKCDNCPQSLCDSLGAMGELPPTVTCFNPAQYNVDGDARGDACDLCPNTGSTKWDPDNPYFLLPEPDTDHDGIGNDCDKCKKPDPYKVCQVGQCPIGQCLIEPGAAFGHCQYQTDSDNDGVPDACDECPGFKTQEKLNSNSIAEDREKQIDPDLQHLADACEPVPLVRVPQQKAVGLTSQQFDQLVLGDGTGPDDVTEIPGDRWLGIDLSAPTKVQTVKRKVAYRHCTCVDNFGNPIPKIEKCVHENSDAVCSSSKPLEHPESWKRISGTVVLSTGASFVLDATGFTAERDFSTSKAPTEKLTWQWRKDVLSGSVTGLGSCPGTGPLDCKTHGALLTHTEKAAPYASDREKNHVLGDVFQLIDTPAIAFNFELPVTCQPPCVRGFVHPDYLKDPDPFGFTALFDKPTPFTIQPSGAVAAFVSPTRALDITSWSDFAILSRLTSGWLWLDAVEPAKVARETDSFAVARGVHSVLLSPDYSGILSVPLGARMTSLGMFPLGLEGPIDPPPGLHDVKGAYSAIESTVYMVGGTLDSGEAAGTVWRWSLQRSNWDLLSTDRMGRYVPSSNVLSVGYTPNGQHLYVLDLDDDDAWVLPQGKHQLARLYRIDLAQGGSTLLGRFPFVSKSKLTSIAVLPDGTLAVVSATDKHYSVWRLDATGSKPVFKGVLAGSGRVLAQPVMGEDRLFLAVQRAGKIEMVDLDADQFHGGQPFTSL